MVCPGFLAVSIEIAGLKPETQAFRFVEILAKSGSTPVSKNDLAVQLSPGREDGDQAARSAKTAANKLIKVALETKGLDFEDPFRSENGRYRLTVPAWLTG